MEKEYIAVISEAAVDYRPVLEKKFDVLTIPADRVLPHPTASHPDMLFCRIGDTLVVPHGYYTENYDLIDSLIRSTSLSLILSDCTLGNVYPHDIAMNVLLCGEFAFSLSDCTAFEIKSKLEVQGVRLINIKQGYAACTSLYAGGALITADPSAAAAAEKVGMDVTVISEGHIHLKGYATGFIGGASGVCGQNVYFFGSPDTHPDGKKIRDALSHHGFKVSALSDGTLTDFGGILFLEKRRFC